LLRAEYVSSLATNQSDAVDQYHLAALQDQAAKVNLQHQQSAAQQQVSELAKAKQAVVATQGQLQGAYNQDQGQIATLVAQAQAAAAAEAAREAAARLAAQKAAQVAAAQAAAAQAAAARAAIAPSFTPASSGSSSGGNSSSGGSTSGGGSANPAPAFSVAPPVGHGASGAVAAAESRVGDPYVWGASGPSAFDCSGLVMWAYAQVGISLPHFSGAQYADTTHISMSQLQPGDLVFPSDPGSHVAMYAGNGEIVEAPYTGATVHVVPMGSWFVYASRVA
jgi:cell wall-associated NlpC family hydrolase